VAEWLTAWLYGTPVATLIPAPEYRITLKWRDEGIERWGLGSRVLSVGLPLGAVVGPRDMRGLDFFENVLPEGPALAQMATLAGVRPADTFGILAAFGHDCAGAIMLLPDGEQPGAGADSGYRPIADDELTAVIGDLDVLPLGAAPERGFRPSLAGFQRKALVGRTDDGTWELPYGDAPSTWILKPDGPHAMAANEATCLRLAASCGLDVPRTELLDLDGLPVLAVERYDRRPSPGEPERVHQEDGCQATGNPPASKYQEQGGPALRDLAALLRDYGNVADVTELLRRTTFNMAVGNADAHAKNCSVLHDVDGQGITLTPFYDVLSTITLKLTDGTGRPMHADTRLGQQVGGKTDIRHVTAADLADEAATWGIRRRTATTVITEMLARVIDAVRTADGDERVLATIRQQAENVIRLERTQ
jgi:serine/threonine-protein kinase HipA